MHRGDRYSYLFEFQADIRPGYYSVCPSIAYSQLEHKWMDYVENAELFRLVDPVPDRTVFGVCLPLIAQSVSRRFPRNRRPGRQSGGGLVHPEPDPRFGFQPDLYQRYGFLARLMEAVFGTTATGTAARICGSRWMSDRARHDWLKRFCRPG